MRTNIIIFVLLLVFVTTKSFGDEIVIQGPQLEDRVVILVDVSGSMNATKSPINTFMQSLNKTDAPYRPSSYDIAISWLRRIIQGISDDGKLKVYAFATECAQYEFEPEGSKDGWLLLPNLEELQKCSGWLDNVKVGEGSTDITNAIICIAKDTKDCRISLVLISDLADENFKLESFKDAIDERSMPMIINIIGIGPYKVNHDRAIEIVKESGGTYLKTN